jgi:hypothetical protein
MGAKWGGGDITIICSHKMVFDQILNGQDIILEKHKKKKKISYKFALDHYGCAANDSRSAALSCLLYAIGEGINFLSFSSFHTRGKVKSGNLFKVA